MMTLASSKNQGEYVDRVFDAHGDDEGEDGEGEAEEDGGIGNYDGCNDYTSLDDNKDKQRGKTETESGDDSAESAPKRRKISVSRIHLNADEANSARIGEDPKTSSARVRSGISNTKEKITYENELFDPEYSRTPRRPYVSEVRDIQAEDPEPAVESKVAA